jgi:hypothetical protein
MSRSVQSLLFLCVAVGASALIPPRPAAADFTVEEQQGPPILLANAKCEPASYSCASLGCHVIYPPQSVTKSDGTVVTYTFHFKQIDFPGSWFRCQGYPRSQQVGDCSQCVSVVCDVVSLYVGLGSSGMPETTQPVYSSGCL